MTTRQKSLFDRKTVGLKAVAAMLLLLIAIGSMVKLRSYAYAKLTPISIELAVTALAKQSLAVSYDYGYGFNTAHRQLVRLAGVPQEQVKRLTISAWKSVLAVQVEAENGDTVTLRSATFKRGGNVLRISSPEPASGTVILLVQDVPAKFASSFVDG